MAEAALISALQKLAVVAAKKGMELYEVHDQIEPMRRNLEMFLAYLRDADSNQHKSESGKVWVSQVRELAYRIGSAMDTFLVEIEKNCPKSSGFLRKFKSVFKHPIKLNTLSGEFKAINEEMKRIYNTRTLLGITELGSGVEQPAELPFRPTKPIDIDDSEVVGFHDDKVKFISHLLDKNISRRTVLSIVGVGGLGKTTLASKVYKSAELNVEFPCRAWVSISQSFDANKIYREILYSVDPKMKERCPPPPNEEVWEELKKSLSGKRYLIILDDVWTTDLWEQLKKVIPENNNASRIIITTRNLDVALTSDRRTQPHNLRYLTEDESLTLLFIKAQQDVQLGKYPSHLVEVAKKLIKKCGRLPLALVVLGRLLGTKPATNNSWNRVYKTLDWHLNDEVNKCTQTLRMSYQELSYEQKQRFLYFAAFPEDHKISPEHIIRLWIAEGLVPVDGEGTMEERAEDYLEDLAKRCLVQVHSEEVVWDGYSQYYVMHDLVRDLAIYEAQEENFFTVFSKPEDSSKHATKEIHRVALQQLHTPIGYDIHSINIRSLLCFGGSSVPNYVGFTRQLRVLVIENIDFFKISVSKNWLENLVHMRYLGLRNCGSIEKIVDNISFSSMKNLETFDFDESYGYKYGDENPLGPLWEVPTLRHVIFSNNIRVYAPLKWDNLKNLQTLEWVVLTDIPKLETNINLRTLNILFEEKLDSPEQSWKALIALLSRAENLVSLYVSYSSKIFFTAIGMKKLPCYERIQSLYINGVWERACIPSLEIFPIYLTELNLFFSHLKEDPMPILERLPYLTILSLRSDAYIGGKMVCSTGGFPNLQILMFSWLFEFNEWEVEEGAMPTLSKLEIRSCNSLSPFPELQNVTSLQELIVAEYFPKLEMRLRSKQLYKIKHIPIVRFEDPLMLSRDVDDEEEDDDGEDNDDEEEEDDEEDDDDVEEDDGGGDDEGEDDD